MPVTIATGAEVSYEFKCGFRAVTIPGQGLSCSVNLSGKGPREGFVPTDNARCTLKHLGGAEPVTATVNAKTGAVTATAAPGATAYLNVTT